MEQPRLSESDVPVHNYPPVLAPLCEPLLLEKCDEISGPPPSNKGTSKSRSKSDIPDGGVQSYPSLIDPPSTFLPPIRDAPEPSSKASRQFFLAALNIRENSQVNFASVSLPFKKHARSKSLPETTLPIPIEASKVFQQKAVPSPTPSPYKEISSRPSSDADISISQLRAASGDYPSWAESFLAYKEGRKRRRSPSNSQGEITQSVRQADSDSHLATLNPPLEHQVSKEHRRGATWPKNLPLPPQEWYLDTYKPMIPAASIPLPTSKARQRATTTTTAIPPTLLLAPPPPPPLLAAAAGPTAATEPAAAVESAAATEPARLPTIIITLAAPVTAQRHGHDTADMSRLHPNAAWSQLASWAHKKSVRLGNENAELRAENSTLRDMLGRLSRVLSELGDDEQAGIRMRLDALPDREET